jgi:hypothetical protein
MQFAGRVGPQGRIETVRLSSRRSQELHWLTAKPGFDTAFGLPFDGLRASLNRRFGFQPCNLVLKEVSLWELKRF